jgi:agmatinase
VSSKVNEGDAFLGIAESDIATADVILLPVAYEGGVSFGLGTSRGPKAIWRASREIETWDEELEFDLATLRLNSQPALIAGPNEMPCEFLSRVYVAARTLHQHHGLVFAVGGDHSITPPLARSCANQPDDLSDVTIVQFDAHSDLRDEYEGNSYSHACAMRRLSEKGAQIVAIGVRSAERDEFDYGRLSGQVRTFTAQALWTDLRAEKELLALLTGIRGRVYLTVDIDALSNELCPSTGTPQPGGIGWWQILKILRHLLKVRESLTLIGCDLVETVPADKMTVNEVTAARLITKILAYYFGSGRAR